MNEVYSMKQGGISAGTLKIIAVLTMLIDHFAATVLVRYIYETGDGRLGELYYAMRQIGRIAFPIYCFLLIEGLEHTHHKGKYLGRMFLLAFISEIPFDLAFSSEVLEFGYQNIFFTLTIALAAMMILEWLPTRVHQRTLQKILTVVVSLCAMTMAWILRTDYSGAGVACILLMYFARKNRQVQLIVGYAAFVLLLGELAALPAFVAMVFYQGKKGISNKLFFYGFYPVHLLVLYLICVIMNTAAIPAI